MGRMENNWLYFRTSSHLMIQGTGQGPIAGTRDEVLVDETESS